MFILRILLFFSFILIMIVAHADDVEVVIAEAKCQTDCTISVTLKHADTGWEHYANRWEVLDEEGNIFATRVLHHPHVNEQPFTRSLSNIKIPQGVKKVWVRGNDSVHGVGKTYLVELLFK